MKQIVLKAPSHLCIYNLELLSETLNFFNDINSGLSDETLITIDFQEIEYLTAAAALALFATVNTVQISTKNPNKLRFWFPKEKLNAKGHRLIVKTGLSRALLAGTEQKLKNLHDSNIHFSSSTNPQQHLIDTSEFIIKSNIVNELEYQLVTSAVTEAVLNVYHHAYKDPTSEENTISPVKQTLVDELGERWWQCLWYDDILKKWILIICDFGIGIAQSFTRSRSSHLDPELSERALSKAMTLGQSRFDGAGRGNGSEDIKRVVTATKSHSLVVYSGGTRYSFGLKNDQPTTEKLPLFFKGTLIEWSLRPCGEVA